MATKTTKKATEVKEEREVMKYQFTMPDGSVIEGSCTLRAFQPNQAKGFQNFGFSGMINDGRYAGNFNIRDNDKKVFI